MLLKLKRTPGLYLVGFMGSGKSAVGRLLADELGLVLRRHRPRHRERRRASPSPRFSTRAAKRNSATSSRKRCASACGKSSAASPWCWPWAAARLSMPQSEAARRARRHGLAGLSVPAHRARLDGQTHRPLARDPEKFRAALMTTAATLRQSRAPHRSRYRRSGGDCGRDSEAPDFLACMAPSLRRQALRIFQRRAESGAPARSRAASSRV